MDEDRSILRDAVKGAVAGAVATWAMGRMTTAFYERQSEQATRDEEQARDGETAFVRAAERGADLAGIDADRSSLERAGSALHWGLGVGAGVVYGALRGRMLEPGWRTGFQFGSGFFVLVDEVANPVLGFTPGPEAFPWQAHARGFAGHGVFGIAAEATMRVLDRFW
jgi:hypothetical protein